MPTRAEIDQSHKATHDSITQAYYVDRILSKADFDSQHLVLVKKTERALIDNGYYVPSPPPSPTNWKALWLAADTIEKKISLLAKRLEME